MVRVRGFAAWAHAGCGLRGCADGLTRLVFEACSIAGAAANRIGTERGREGGAAGSPLGGRGMGAAESRGGRNEDKRTSRREHKDVFVAAIEQMRAKQLLEVPPVAPPAAAESGLHVCLRKRPIFAHELTRGDFDAVTCTGASVVVHDARMRPDLHSMYLRHSTFAFDRVFSERSDNDDLYAGTAGPLVRRSVEGGIATVFMFGQTGSGKTYTMSAIHERACREIFELAEASDPALEVFLTYVELAGDRCKDMLNEAAPVKMLTDAEGEVHLRGVVEARATGHAELHKMIIAASKLRATAATGVHDQSSRSHALCRVTLRHPGGGDAVHGSFTMVDLAGTERNKDSLHHDAKLRKETTEINRSLMALKDCVRERAQGASHISFRKDKLTQLLKSCFTMPEAYTVVIATVSPSCSDTEHTLSTLQHSSQMDGQTTDCAEVIEEDLDAPVSDKPKRKPGVGSGSKAAAASSKRATERIRAPRKARLDTGDSSAKTAGAGTKASSRRKAIAVPGPAGKGAALGSGRPSSAGSKEPTTGASRRQPVSQGQSRARRRPTGNAGASSDGATTATAHRDRTSRTDFGRRSLNSLQEPLETVDESKQVRPRGHATAASRLDRRAARAPKPAAPQLSARAEQEHRTNSRPVNKSQQRRDEKAAKERSRRASSVPHQRSQRTASSEGPDPSRDHVGSNTRPTLRHKTSPASSRRMAASPDSSLQSTGSRRRASAASPGLSVSTAWEEESPGAGRLSFTEEEIEALARQQLQQRMKEIKLDLKNQGKVEESQSLPSFGPDSAKGRGNRGKGQSLAGPAGAGGSTAGNFSARGLSSRRALGGDRGARTAREPREASAHSSAEQLRELGTCKVGDTYRVMKQVRVRAGPELDSPRLSLLGGGEIITVLETWQSREGQLRVRCDAGWTSIYSKDGQTRLLQRTAAGSRSPPVRTPSTGRLHSPRGGSSPSADAESMPYSDGLPGSTASRSPARSPVVPHQISPDGSGAADGYTAGGLQSPIRTDVPLPMVEDGRSPSKPGPSAALNTVSTPTREPELVLQEVGADEFAGGHSGDPAPPVVGGDASPTGSSPGRGHGTPEIPLPSAAGESVASPQMPPPPLAPA